VDTVEAFGTLKIADVLEPATRLAEGGFVPSVLCIYTLALLVSRVPVSELHSSLVGTLYPHKGWGTKMGTSVAKVRRDYQGSITRWE
jgi:hypothetical protein